VLEALTAFDIFYVSYAFSSLSTLTGALFTTFVIAEKSNISVSSTNVLAFFAGAWAGGYSFTSSLFC